MSLFAQAFLRRSVKHQASLIYLITIFRCRTSGNLAVGDQRRNSTGPGLFFSFVLLLYAEWHSADLGNTNTFGQGRRREGRGEGWGGRERRVGHETQPWQGATDRYALTFSLRLTIDEQ